MQEFRGRLCSLLLAWLCFWVARSFVCIMFHRGMYRFRYLIGCIVMIISLNSCPG